MCIAHSIGEHEGKKENRPQKKREDDRRSQGAIPKVPSKGTGKSTKTTELSSCARLCACVRACASMRACVVGRMGHNGVGRHFHFTNQNLFLVRSFIFTIYSSLLNFPWLLDVLDCANVPLTSLKCCFWNGWI